MRIGLTLDEYFEFWLMSVTGADPEFHAAAEAERNTLFPMNATSASNHLRSRGYDCRPAMLDLLVSNGVVQLSQPEVWTKPDVEAAADHFEEAGIFTPYAAMCEAMGCRYADFLRPLREAAERESKKYDQPIPNDDQYFVMHRVPPRGGPDGHDAIISFTLCDDIRERLERGEGV